MATQEEAGSVHVAVLAVAPWESYRTILQPGFTLTGQQALNEVMRTNRFASESTLDALKMKASALKIRGESETRAEDVDFEDTSRQGWQATPAMLLEMGLQGDAMAQYWTATALYQEVQLLNRYVRDAAIRHGYEPYLVRLQISLLPRARREPYDAYSTVSFFMAPDDSRPGQHPLKGLGDEPEPGPEKEEDSTPPDRGPIVLPLLVTDNLEGSVASRTSQVVRQFAAALAQAGGSLPVSLGIDRSKSRTESELGLDFNSLLSVARVSDNTLRVRLGAMQQGSTAFAMVPRTHSVTLLLMVPEKSTNTVAVVARTTMTDAETGADLPERTDAAVAEHFARLGVKYDVSPELLEGLLPRAQENRPQSFFSGLRTVVGVEHVAWRLRTSLWLDLVTITVGGQYATNVIDLPAAGTRPVPELFPRGEVALLFDDGVACTTTLQNGKELSPVGLRATLVLGKGRGERFLPATAVELERAGERAYFLFPSLVFWHLDADAAEGVRLFVEYEDGPSRTYEVRYRKPPPKPEPKPK